MINLKARDYLDFLIVGAGPAGLLAGIGLARLGFKVEIIERHKDQIRPICGEYLSPEGKEQLLSMDLGDVLNGFQEVKGMILYSPAGLKVETDFPAGKTGVSLNREIFQKRLSEIFLSVGGQIHYATQLSGITVTNQIINAETQNRNFIARFILGADGRNSAVAKLLNMKAHEIESKRIAIHVYLKPKHPLSLYGQMHVLPGGQYIGINPINENEVNFSLVADQEAVKSMGGLKELLNYWIKTRESLHEQFPKITSEPIKTTSPISRRAIDLITSKGALLGDASGFVDPLTGEGITTAIKSARILCHELHQGTTIEEGFLKYARRRKIEFAEKEKLNRFFQIIIRSPRLADSLAMALLVSKKIRDTFIGIIGNIYTPSEGAKKLFSDFFAWRS